jgi:ATP-dependent Clp protease ATP-binding subunit ClpC
MGSIYSNENEENFESVPKSGNTAALDAYGTNITKLAKTGSIDPVIGREEEIKRTIQILGRRKKNNPILVGEPGVGKCVIGSTLITVKNTLNGEISKMTMSEFNDLT